MIARRRAAGLPEPECHQDGDQFVQTISAVGSALAGDLASARGYLSSDDLEGGCLPTATSTRRRLTTP
jgi:hypothetical protein